MPKTALTISKNALPIIIMIALIPFFRNDYILTVLYIMIIMATLLLTKTTHKDIVILGFGFFIMIVCEYLFVSTGVEFFTRNSLFGIMPLWLPVLWSYGFVGIKRSIAVL